MRQAVWSSDERLGLDHPGSAHPRGVTSVVWPCGQDSG